MKKKFFLYASFLWGENNLFEGKIFWLERQGKEHDLLDLFVSDSRSISVSELEQKLGN